MKRFCAFISVLLVLSAFCLTVLVHAGDLPPVPLTTSSSDTPARIAGDANDDKLVDLRDAVVIMRYLSSGWNVTVNASAADVNGDHVVSLLDAALITRYVVGGWDVTLI